MMDNIDFDKDFTSDEDVNEMINSIVVTVGNRIQEDESKPSITNPIKMSQVAFTYKALRYMTRGSKAEVSYKLHEPFNSVGSVSVVGKDVSFSNPDWFCTIAGYASNIDIYPRTDGVVQMTFTFYGLTMPIE